LETSLSWNAARIVFLPKEGGRIAQTIGWLQRRRVLVSETVETFDLDNMEKALWIKPDPVVLFLEISARKEVLFASESIARCIANR